MIGKLAKELNHLHETSLIDARGECTLKIKGTDQFVTILAEKNVVSNRMSRNVLTLDALAMVRLIFGMSKPSQQFNLNEKTGFLDAIFPVPLYIWSLETI